MLGSWAALRWSCSGGALRGAESALSRPEVGLSLSCTGDCDYYLSLLTQAESSNFIIVPPNKVFQGNSVCGIRHITKSA